MVLSTISVGIFDVSTPCDLIQSNAFLLFSSKFYNWNSPHASFNAYILTRFRPFQTGQPLSVALLKPDPGAKPLNRVRSFPFYVNRQFPISATQHRDFTTFSLHVVLLNPVPVYTKSPAYADSILALMLIYYSPVITGQRQCVYSRGLKAQKMRFFQGFIVPPILPNCVTGAVFAFFFHV